MERRSFFRRLLGGLAAAVALPFLPKPSKYVSQVAIARDAQMAYNTEAPRTFACGHRWAPASLFTGHGDASRKCLRCEYYEACQRDYEERQAGGRSEIDEWYHQPSVISNGSPLQVGAGQTGKRLAVRADAYSLMNFTWDDLEQRAPSGTFLDYLKREAAL